MIKQINRKNYRYTVLAMTFLEKLLGSKITVSGLQNIPPKPVLFVSNHFTRSETFIVPYIIYKHTKRQVRCLADSSLFHGVVGRFLKSVGALSTKDQKRDTLMISDLISGNCDWMIYPEGSMVKSKEIHNDGRIIATSDGLSRVKSGSAVLALKSELYRSDIIEAKKQNKKEILKEYQKQFDINFDDNLENYHTSIVPVNITYYPIRPGTNIIQKIAGRILKTMPKQLSEELEIEGNLLLSAKININFGQAINVSSYIQNTRKLIYQIPIISNETKVNLVLKYLKYHLTNQFMDDIYSNTRINIDHIVSAILYFYPQNEISINHLKNLIYLSTYHISILKKYHLNDFITEQNLYKILNNKQSPEFESIILLAETLGIIQKVSNKNCYFIDKDKLNQKYNFQTIRLENTIQVILNEFLLLENAASIVKRNSLLDENIAERKSFECLVNHDLSMFKDDYKIHYDTKLSKDQSVGKPSFLDGNLDNGILLVHGYLSAPKEMEEIAKYFNKLGYKIYSVRLKGHGTAPINLADTKWQDWYDSINLGYSILNLKCKKISIIGFSMGSLLGLLMASEKDNKISSVACINPALNLRDIRAKFASGVHLWNDLLTKLHIKKGQLSYVENHSESPTINYSQNYINGIEQLEKLMKICEQNLHKISCATLIIQSDEDPVIDSEKSKSIIENSITNKTEFEVIKSDKHMIISKEGCQKVFERIEKFLEKSLLQN